MSSSAAVTVPPPAAGAAVAAQPLEHQQRRHSVFHHHHNDFAPISPPSFAAAGAVSATPLGVILVSKDESAERVLFMYPFEQQPPPSSSSLPSSATTPSAGQQEPLQKGYSPAAPGPTGGRADGRGESAAAAAYSSASSFAAAVADNEQQTTDDGDCLISLPVKMLAPLLVAKGSNGNGTPFEIKVDNVRFVGFPWCISGCVHSLAVVFILRGSADRHIVDAFQRLSKKIAIAINTEQQRCNYLRDQISLMQPSHDEYEALPDELKKGRCPYTAILEKSGLAKHLRDIFEDVCKYGMVDVFVDDCIEVGFCVEPKALCHAGLASRSPAEVEATMRHIRPYHGLLFLDESIPSPDSNPFIRRFFDEYEPSKSFEELAHLSGIPIGQLLQIVRHFLLWARAMLIYPICTANVYANAPQQPHNFRTLDTQFAHRFGPDCGPLAEVLEAFSPLCSLGSFLQDMTIYAGRPSLPMSLMVFLLRNQLLVQLHSFFFLLPPPSSVGVDPHRPRHHNSPQRQHNHRLANIDDDATIGDYDDDADADDDAEEAQHYRHCAVPLSPKTAATALSTRICTLVNDSRLLSAELKAHILSICARAVHLVGVPEEEMFDVLSAFLTVVPFLNGRHHMEDIMYRTQLERSTVIHVLDTFTEIVCPFYCQDVVLDDE